MFVKEILIRRTVTNFFLHLVVVKDNIHIIQIHFILKYTTRYYLVIHIVIHSSIMYRIQFFLKTGQGTCYKVNLGDTSSLS
jgi:hypothetical protein